VKRRSSFDPGGPLPSCGGLLKPGSSSSSSGMLKMWV
jgi:hypothetical protein